MRTLCKTSNSLRTVLFLNERGKLWLNRRFLSYVFLSSEFKLENIYRGVNFCGKKYGYFLFKETYFWGSLEKSQKIGTRKNFVQLGSFCSRILGSWEGNIKTDELWINSETLDRDITEDLYYTGKKIKNDNNNNRGKRTKTKKNCRWPIYVFFFFFGFLFALYN